MRCKYPILSLVVALVLATNYFGQSPNHNFRPYFTKTSGTYVYAMAAQPDGKFLVAGWFDSANGYSRHTIVRFNPDGSVDEGFASTILSNSVSFISIQDDGKIILAGDLAVRINGILQRGVVRLFSNGTVDESFFIGTGSFRVYCATAQPDGKVVVGGAFTTISGVEKSGIARFNPDGSFDNTFVASTGGDLFTMVALPDGKILIGGSMGLVNGVTRFHLARLNNDGTLDNSFAYVAPSPFYWVYAIKFQPDGKILLARRFPGLPPDHGLVARLNADGTVDPTFTDQIPDASSPEAYALDLQPDGKILVAGRFGNSTQIVNTLYRLNPDGSRDSSFTVLNSFNGRAVLVQPTGKIIVGGAGSLGMYFYRLNEDGQRDFSFPASLGDSSAVRVVKFAPDGKMYVGGDFENVNGQRSVHLVRLDRQGRIDPSFNLRGGTNGNAVLDLAVQPDGKVIVAGDFGVISGLSRARLARLNVDGTVDPTFSSPTFSEVSVVGIGLQPDGQILVGGSFSTYKGVPRKNMARLNPDGNVDLSFDVGSPGFSHAVHLIVPQPDGKIVVGGAFNYLNSALAVRIVRLNSDGSRDVSFNPGGSGVGPIQWDDPLFAIALQSDGKIIIGGSFGIYNDVLRAGLARLNPDGTLDTSFSADAARVTALELQSDGKILVGGTFATIGGVARDNFARLNSDGSVDPTFNFATNDSVLAIRARSDDEIAVAGQFETFDGGPHTNLAKFGGTSNSFFDFDGDGKTDIGIFRPTGGEWWINRSSNGQTLALQFGAATDLVAPSDYTGDGKTDITFWRPTTGEWFVLRSEDNSFFAFPFGANGDTPVPADYDADGKADAAVFRPSIATWFISQSGGGGTRIFQFGAAADKPIVGDYDGDGKADVAIWRPNAGGAEWWINRSTAGLLAMQFGANTDKPVIGDYTGDGKTDVAFWRPASGEWYIIRSEDFSFFAFPFGANGDTPAPGDYDGDGKTDPTVFRPASSTWFIARSAAGTQIVQFGANGDRPIPGAFVP